MNNLLFTIGIPAIVVIVAMVVIGLVMTRMYHRSTRQVSLVKTGQGGRKIVMDGGIIIIPGLHELTKINMQTTRLEMSRSGTSALITLDRMRVDVGVEFYINVKGEETAIAAAAQTLGNSTFNSGELRSMIEGKLVDGLRSVAAQMNIDDLHEKRGEFVQQVQTAVAKDLEKNGLQLEAVSLTHFDQTPMESMDENNVFNAAGMQNQVSRIAESKKKRADIEAETVVSVAKSAQRAEIEKYEIQRAQEEARVEQSIKMEELKNQEIGDHAEKREAAELRSQEAAIARAKGVQSAQIESDKALELAEQDRQISVQERSREESRARAEADDARAKAIESEESIKTAREVAVAERNKRIVILRAEEQAEQQATSIRVSAKAERDAAADRAAAIKELATAAAEEVTIRAEAEKYSKLAEAEGTRELIAAENTLSAEIIDFRLAKQKLEALPGIISEMVKPAEKIGSITIHKLDGMNGFSNTVAAGTANGGGNGSGVVNEAFDQLRAMSVQMPMLKSIGEQVGISMDKPMAEMISDVVDPKAKVSVQEEASADEALSVEVETPTASETDDTAA